MTIKTVCERCGLTKKAVAYYEQRGLIHPAVSENGYRSFSEEDVQRLLHIGVLRALGLSVVEIDRALRGETDAVLHAAAFEREAERDRQDARCRILRELADSRDFAAAREKIRRLRERESILDRLAALFPGAYGQYLCLHFGRFLQQPVETPDQRAAFEIVIQYLDDAGFAVPDELCQMLEEAAVHFDRAFAEQTFENMEQALADPGAYLDIHADEIAAYLSFKQSPEYRNSPAYRLSELMTAFQQESGYCEVFLPALRRLSPAYRAYWERMQSANAVFTERLERKA